MNATAEMQWRSPCLPKRQFPECRLRLPRSPFLDNFRLTIRDLGVLNSVSAAAFGLTSPCFLYIIECLLSNREAQWLVLEAKTNEMRSSMPRPAYLRSAVLPLPQRQRYQNKLASPKELCLRTSRLRLI